jgi:hypothetical protein
VTSGDVTTICTRLFDDAAMFPPEGIPTAVALRRHLQHQSSWYSDLVGPLVCLAGRLGQLEVAAERMEAGWVRVAAVVSDGLNGVPRLAAAQRRLDRVEIASVEVELGAHHLREAQHQLKELLNAGVHCYVEVDASRLTEEFVHELTRTGLRLKLRLGQTLIDAFCDEQDLAQALVLCAGEPLKFKCNSGLHLAVRHRDPETAFEHHGYLNLALAARAAGATGNVQAVAAILRTRRAEALVDRMIELTGVDAKAIRSVLGSVSTSNVIESVNDLVDLRLVTRAR